MTDTSFRTLRPHIILFLITIFTTLSAGALQMGIDIFSEPSRIIEGYPFSLSLMAILLAHELSHFFASRIHNTVATLPYFIPAPSIIGTFGAFIKMKSPIVKRTALVDIGASGPIAGFAVALIVTIYGLTISDVASLEAGSGGMILGDSILFSLLSKIVIGAIPEGKDVLLHPVAFAGWIGFFVTAMNLLPIGQLDGGHIAYALFGEKRHGRLSLSLTVLLAAAGLSKFYLYSDMISSPLIESIREHLWEGWAIWAFLLFLLGLKHPPVMYWDSPLQKKRRIIGWLSFIIFIITFTPMPFRMG